MEAYEVFKDLAIILIAAKMMGLVARKCKMPQVVGQILAGLIIGPSVLGWVQQSDFLAALAEIGVVLLMFSAGLETDLKELIRTGPVAFLIACCGVLVPLVGGALLYMAFYGFAPWGDEEFYKALFIGTIMTATSVSITVQCLKEMGKLKGKVGTTIVSAAIIDDVIGIVVLTFVIGLKNPESNAGAVVVSTLLFFLVAFVGGYLFYRLFRWLDRRNPHTRRLSIAGLAFCLGMAYIAEKYFGIADITGAYVAGIVLCSVKDSSYIAQKMDTGSYLFFGPVFFAGIGLKTSFDNVDATLIWFSIGFVLVALICKVVGCGLVSRICGFNWNDSLKIGVGMMTRGEVALIVSQKGLSVGLLGPEYFTSVILLILVSSVVTPILLKILYAKDSPLQSALPADRKGS